MSQSKTENEALIEASPQQATGNLPSKDFKLFLFRSLTPQQATGNALALLVQKLYDALANQNFQGYMDLMADDVEYHAAGDCPVSGVHKGKKELMKIGPASNQTATFP